MKITTEHPDSSYGIPVILGDDGGPLDYAAGIRAIRRKLDLTTEELGAMCGRSRRTVENWEQGRPVPADALNALAPLLRKRR